MSSLLIKAFEKASLLPPLVQNQIARDWLNDIEEELKWDETISKTQDKLAILAQKALKEYKRGTTKKMGFDKL